LKESILGIECERLLENKREKKDREKIEKLKEECDRFK